MVPEHRTGRSQVAQFRFQAGRDLTKKVGKNEHTAVKLALKDDFGNLLSCCPDSLAQVILGFGT
jgi:hypothetical protein